MTSLQEKLEQGFAPGWRPDDTDADGVAANPVFGTFARMEKAQTSFGPCWIMILAGVTDADGEPVKTNAGEVTDELSVWLLHTVLVNECARAKPKPGERVGIKYLGKQKPSGGGNSFHAYRVKVDRVQEEEFDWASLDPDDGFEEGRKVYDQPDANAKPGDDDIPY